MPLLDHYIEQLIFFFCIEKEIRFFHLADFKKNWFYALHNWQLIKSMLLIVIVSGELGGAYTLSIQRKSLNKKN